MATNFMDLSEEERGFLLKKWLRNLTDQPTPIGDNGDAPRMILSQGGVQKNIQNLPTDAQLNTLKNLLTVGGSMNQVFGNVPNLSNRVLGAMIPDRTLAYATNVSQSLMKTSQASAQSEHFRKLGFEEEEVTNEIMQTAVTNPKEFIKRKNEDIVSINKQAFEAYTKAYTSFREFGYSDESAFEKAKSAAQSYKNELMKVHNKQFSESLTKDAKSRIGQNV